MTGVRVRSAALHAAATRVVEVADELREDAARLATVLARAGPPVAWGTSAAPVAFAWAHAEASALAAVGPGGTWGQALALDTLALELRAAAGVYEAVDASVAAVLAGIGAGADLAARGGWLTDGGGVARVSTVGPTLAVDPQRGLVGAAGLVAAGEGLAGGRVRVVEVSHGDGGSAWVVVVPGTQEWSPRAGPNPFDLTTDVRALTGEATVAAAGVTAALAHARARSGRATVDDPVLLVGHSQGGILAAALASDPAFRRSNRVTHVVTSGSPVGLFPVPSTTRVLSVEHADDPVPRLDLTPNPADASWLTIVAPAGRRPLDVARHRLGAYVDTVRVLEAAPRGTVAGLDAWQASAGAFVGVPVRSVSEVVVERGWQNPRS